MEKIRKGMHILVREGSVSKDLHALMPIITERLSPHLALCTDDRNPLDIAEEGHLDFIIRTAIAHGVNRSPFTGSLHLRRTRLWPEGSRPDRTRLACRPCGGR